jgi:ACS family pantothenate transporter-like MFS transporter
LVEVYSSSPEKRAIATGTAVVLVYANAWLALYLWPANEAPPFKWGYKMSVLFICVSLVSSLAYCFFVYKRAVRTNNALREEREAAKDAELNLEEIVESSESVKSTISIAKNLAVKS